jgi:hypothetical protein
MPRSDEIATQIHCLATTDSTTKANRGLEGSRLPRSDLKFLIILRSTASLARLPACRKPSRVHSPDVSRGVFMMRLLSPLKSVLAFLPLLAAAGCQNNDIPLAKPDQAVIITPPKPQDVPKDMRPGKGTSAGMNYDPSGVNGPPPK